MSTAESSFSKFRSRPRQAVRLSQESLVRESFLADGGTLPLVIEPAAENLNLVSWAASNREGVRERIDRHGGILFRNFDVKSVEVFEKVIESVAGEPLRYTERSSPRSAVSGRIYTSTDYPPQYPIFLHSEQSYNLRFAMLISFCCMIQPAEGGSTPIADTRKVYQRIDPEIRQRFIERGYRYVRNFGDGFGLSWQEAFQTSDPAAVERYCHDNQIEFEWKEDGRRLRTSQVRRVVARHPRTGELSWFNHLTFFHVSTLVSSVRDSLLREFCEGDLPNNTYYGDGEPVEPEVMEHLRDAYLQETVTFPWQAGDVLLLDNILVAHGRQPFSGDRKVVVAMAEPVSWADV
ncbi:MAG TPA: TauD/TfdA family dioxygenase [Thermoanaerobaculia bacterium]|nr:TauD/TfdA family dioxygenase [Thermoanaerobaculia bacterium]